MISKTFIFLAILTICMVVHELGHLLAGILFKAKVKGIHIFYCPGIRLLSTHSKWISHLCPKLKKYPEVSIGLLPLFSVVQFDYTLDDNTNKDPQLLENKPAWQRLLVYSAGVIMNYLTAIIVALFLESHYSPILSTIDTIHYSIEDTNHHIVKTTHRLCHMADNIWQKTESEEASPTESQVQPTSKGDYYEVISTLSPTADYNSLMMLWQFNIIMFVFNLVPISPLDGGKMLFCLYEITFMRKPNSTLTTVAALIGSVLLLGLSFYVVIDEIIKDI